MSIAPVICSVTVMVPPARAFDLFTSRMGQWWPLGKTVGAAPHAAIVVEPRPGGRWFERDASGVEAEWGRVIAWEPPERLLLGWQLTSAFAYDPDFLTEVEVTFAARGDGGTRVTLEHRGLERFGEDAERVAGQIGRGWPSRLADLVAYADATRA